MQLGLSFALVKILQVNIFENINLQCLQLGKWQTQILSTRRAEAEAYPRSNKTEHAAQSYTARKTNKISMLRNPLEMLLLLLRNTIVEVKALLD